MNTAAETKKRIIDEHRWWKVPLMNFVDDFRYYKDPAMIAEPFELSDERVDAVLASVIETLCFEMRIPVPDWLSSVPACREPYFLTEMENLKAISLVESPAHFRVRKIFVTENFLHRV
jgi:hypothetical protein